MVFYALFSWLDYGIYSMVKFVMRLIILLANYEFFNETQIGDLADKVYVVLGVLVLFKIIISCVQFMVNPDTFDDKEKGMAGILKKTVICMALLVVVRPAFNFALTIQQTVVATIPSLVMGTGARDFSIRDQNAREELDKIGDLIAGTTLKAFITVRTDENGNLKAEDKMQPTLQSFADNVLNGCDKGGAIWKYFHTEQCDYEYSTLLATAAGIFLLWVLINMALEVGIRAIKLGIIQILAPIPISSYIVSKDKLSKFFKLAVKVYLDLFIRLIVIYFIIFFVKNVVESMTGPININGGYVTDTQESLFLKVIIICALYYFAKNAPKFICDVLGIDGGGFGDMADMFKSPKERYGGALGAMINPFRTTAGNMLTSWQQSKNIRGKQSWWRTTKRIGRMLGAGGRGLAEGTVDSAKAMAAGEDWSKVRQRMKDRDVRSFKKAYEANYYRTLSRKDALMQKAKNARSAALSFIGQTPVTSAGYNDAASKLGSLRSESFTGRAKSEVDKAPAMFRNIAVSTAALKGGPLQIGAIDKETGHAIYDDNGQRVMRDINTSFDVTDAAGNAFKNCDYEKLHNLYIKVASGNPLTEEDWNAFEYTYIDADGNEQTTHFKAGDESIVSDLHERVGKKAYSEYVDIAVEAQKRLNDMPELTEEAKKDMSPDEIKKYVADRELLVSLADREVLDRVERWREAIGALNIPAKEKEKLFTALNDDTGKFLAGANKIVQQYSTEAAKRAKMEQAASGGDKGGK